MRALVLQIIYLILATLAFSSVCWGETIVVNPLSITIQDALDSAQSGDTVLVMPGTYTGDGNRDISFGGKSVALIGVFGPDSTIVDCDATDTDQHRGFLFDHGEDSEAILSGFTIRNTFIKNFGPPDSSAGGGALVRGASPQIRNCVFVNSFAEQGGGISLDSSMAIIDSCIFVVRGGYTILRDSGRVHCSRSSISISNSSFPGSFLPGGGGISCHNSNLILLKCDFFDHYGFGEFGLVGAAIWISKSNVVIDSCNFERNSGSGGTGGAISAFDSVSLEISNSRFADNVANAGGAISAIFRSTVSINNCQFESNNASIGGALYAARASYSISNSSFNNCLSSSGGAAIFAWFVDTGTVSSTSYYSNTASEGGGAIYLLTSSSLLSNCTFYNNRSALGGGSIHCEDTSSADIENCIIAFGAEGPGIFLNDATETATITCTDIYGNAGGDWVGSISDQSSLNGNISADTLFCDTSALDFSLKLASPCLPVNNSCMTLIGAIDSTCLSTDVIIYDDPLIPETFSLDQNYPNPFNGRTTIRFYIQRTTTVNLDIYNALGQHVTSLFSGELSVGSHAVNWDSRTESGEPVSSGVYFYTLKTDNLSTTKMMLYLK